MFGSDNQASAHPAVMEALARANHGRVGSYGDDDWSRRAKELVKQTFETDDLDFYCVGTGGAANGLALSLLCPPWGAVIGHGHAHIIDDEGNGPEFFTSGARMLGLAGDRPRLEAADLAEAAERYTKEFVHGLQPRALSLTNLSEMGLIYSPDQIQALSGVCKAQGWGLHVDGARFANAVVGSGASPADLTWRSGVDILSFGLTKNGALAAEAIVVFGKARTTNAGYLRKRAGQLFSKHRLFTAQFVAMLESGLWLDLAAHANSMATRLAGTLTEAGASIIVPVEGNEVFAKLSEVQHEALQEADVGHYPWAPLGAGAYRFVTSWMTSAGEVASAATALTKR